MNRLTQIITILVFLAASALIFPLTSCTNSELKARESLAALRIPYNKQSFMERVYEGDILAVELFLDAGMDPDAMADMSRWIVLPDHDMEDWMRTIAPEGSKWRAFLTDASFGGVGLGAISFRPVYMPVLTVAKIKAAAQSPKHQYIFNLLLQANASKERVRVLEDTLRQRIGGVQLQGTAAPSLGFRESRELEQQIQREFDERLFGGK